MLTALFDPTSPKSFLDCFTLITILVQIFIFFILPQRIRRVLFLASFVAWRLGYNFGLGYLLKLQSDRQLLVQWARRWDMQEHERASGWHIWLKAELARKMGQDFDIDVRNSLHYIIQRKRLACLSGQH